LVLFCLIVANVDPNGSRVILLMGRWVVQRWGKGLGEKVKGALNKETKYIIFYHYYRYFVTHFTI